MKSLLAKAKQQSLWKWLLPLWLILAYMQAIFTPVLDDEAYYWLWGQRLNWGYFDHPPFVAFITHIASFIAGDGTLAIRLITPLISLATCWFLAQIALSSSTVQQRFGLLLLLWLVVPIVNVYAFITTPDAPLLLGMAFFWWALHHIAKGKTDLRNWTILGIAMAVAMYGKYHAALGIILSILAYPKLLKQKGFWWAFVLSLLLYAPHLYWQYTHHFPSITYHLVARAKGFEWAHLGEFVIAQLAVYGPLLLLLLVPAIRALKASAMKRILVFNAVGFPLVFMLSTLNGRAEAHWSTLGALAASVLVINWLLQPLFTMSKTFTKWTIGLGMVTLVALLSARVLLIASPEDYLRDFNNNQAWAKRIEEEAGNNPVVFLNSYRRASKYQFYTGQLGHSENNYYFRHNQYDLWEHDTLLWNKPVHYITERNYKGLQPIDLLHSDSFYHGVYPTYFPIQRLRATSLSIKKSKRFYKFEIDIFNPYPGEIDFTQPGFAMRLYAAIRHDDELDDLAIVKLQHHKNIVLKPGQNRVKARLKDDFLAAGSTVSLMIQHNDLPQISLEIKKTIHE